MTNLLVEWRSGDRAALDRLIPIVYGELRRVASARLRGEGSPTLQTTALVHEVYLRLVDLDRMTVQNRTHFFAMAARRNWLPLMSAPAASSSCGSSPA